VNRLDRFIRDRRVDQAVRFISAGARVLDVGCDDGALFRRLGTRLGEGVGIDPGLTAPIESERYRLIPGRFPLDGPHEPRSFDAITMLAVLEHLDRDEQKAAAEAIYDLLRPGGRVVVTVPSPRVDWMLHVLIRLRLLHGMDAEAHHGFDPDEVELLLGATGLRVATRRRFELGLNNLFVFAR
jgi:2-polyprenyl-3-methyl-5-hydroxy-6-metoxy-1,4-benzoquinol methylase